MTRQKRKSSGFDQNHEFWPKALDLWRRGCSNAQVAAQAQADGHDLNEDQVRYARNRYWTADELPARGAKWLREAVREATEVYPSALYQRTSPQLVLPSLSNGKVSYSRALGNLQGDASRSVQLGDATGGTGAAHLRGTGRHHEGAGRLRLLPSYCLPVELRGAEVPLLRWE